MFARYHRIQQCRLQKLPGRKHRNHATTLSYATPGTVLLTREGERNKPTIDVLERERVPYFELPLVKSIDGVDKEKFLPALLSKEYYWIIIASPKAAEVFVKTWKEAGQPDVRLAAIGQGAAFVLKKQSSSSLEPEFVGRHIGHLKKLPKPPPGTPPTVLYPASQRARPRTETRLGTLGFEVTRLNVYSTEAVTPETVPSAELARALECDVVAVDSVPAVRTWLQLAGSEHALQKWVACGGEDAAEYVKKRGWKKEQMWTAHKSEGEEAFMNAILEMSRRAAGEIHKTQEGAEAGGSAAEEGEQEGEKAAADVVA